MLSLYPASLPAATLPTRRILLATLAAAVVSLQGGADSSAGSRLIELRDSESVWSGKLVAMDRRTCVIFDRKGEMHRLPIRSLTSFERVAEQYRPLSTAEFRGQLLEEFPRGYEVAGTSHYLVCAPKGKAQTYAELFEAVYRSVDSYYRVRGFPLTTPDTPLVAIVFGTQEEFARYCRRDRVSFSTTLRGYYSLQTNRIALYDDPRLVSQSDPELPPLQAHRAPAEVVAATGLSGQTAGTIVHETTHQVSYNIGIHSRAGVTPTWLCEGLATLLEAPGIRKTTGTRSRTSRTNSERLEWFHRKYLPRHRNGDLARLVTSDQFFNRQTLDAYSLSWAFTFFLAENPTHTRKFIRYLKVVSERDPMADYSSQERLEDFAEAFGDVARLEVEFLRFMDRL